MILCACALPKANFEYASTPWRGSKEMLSYYHLLRYFKYYEEGDNVSRQVRVSGAHVLFPQITSGSSSSSSSSSSSTAAAVRVEVEGITVVVVERNAVLYHVCL